MTRELTNLVDNSLAFLERVKEPFLNESYVNYFEVYVASKFETRIYKTKSQVDQHPL
jgi:hypothetical protein